MESLIYGMESEKHILKICGKDFHPNKKMREHHAGKQKKELNYAGWASCMGRFMPVQMFIDAAQPAP